MGLVFLVTTSSIHPFKGVSRQGAVSFVINDVVYIGLGMERSTRCLNDFWKFDPNDNVWKKIADFPGAPRRNAQSFVIDGKAYVGTGLEYLTPRSKLKFYKDFYQYDPIANKWTEIAEFPGLKRSRSSSFVLNSEGYICGGSSYDNESQKNLYFKDVYRYNPKSNSWANSLDLPVELFNSSSFVIGSNAYVIGGRNSKDYNQTLYSFSLLSKKWKVERENDPDNLTFSEGSTFVYDGSAYLCYGSTKGVVLKFTPPSTFENMNDYLNLEFLNRTPIDYYQSCRQKPISFILKGQPYFGLGSSVTSISFGIFFSDTHNDIRPFGLTLQDALIAESSKKGSVVGSLKNLGLTSTSPFNYSLVNGAGDVDNDKFIIDGDTVRSQIDNLDFETKSSYYIRVQSIDKNNVKSVDAITVLVKDLNEGPPTDIVMSKVMLTGSQTDTIIKATLNATDLDTSEKHIFRFVEGDGDSDNEKFLIIYDEIIFKKEYLSKEKNQSYNIRIKAFDIGRLTLEKQLVFNFSLDDIKTDISPVELSIDDFLIYPNPASDYLEVKYTLSQPKNISLSFFNSQGFLIKKGVRKPLTSGEHQERISTTGLASGIYYIVIESKDFKTIKGVVLK